MNFARPVALLALLSPLLAAGEGLSPPAAGECLVCHASIEDEAATAWGHDVHAAAGMGCADCHGGDPAAGDPDVAMAKRPGRKGVRPFIGAVAPAAVPELCASCHSNAEFMKRFSPLLPTDQIEKYRTSVHGKRLKKGDTKVAQCVSCHGAHGIRKVNDAKSPVYASNLPAMCAKCHADAEFMKPYGIPTNQYADYVGSVHGKALLVGGDVRGAPACNDCHGNHGATPPGLHTIANICGSCHSHNAELFLKGPMAKALSRDPLGECAACHGNHRIIHTSDDWVGDRPGALCVQCHRKGDKGAALAADMSDSIGTAKAEFDRVSAVVEDARLKGMDVLEAADALQTARQALIQARTEIHAFSKPLLDAKLAEGKSGLERALELGRNALREYTARRTGLAVSSLFLTILVISPFLLIRRLPPPGGGSKV